MKIPGYIIVIGILAAGVGILVVHSFMNREDGDTGGNTPKKEGHSNEIRSKEKEERSTPQNPQAARNTSDPVLPRSNADKKKGRILSKTDTPVAGAHIRFCSAKQKRESVSFLGVTNIKKTKRVTLLDITPETTDERGFFPFPENAPSGKCTLVVKAKGFAPYSQEITLPPDKDIEIRLQKGGTLTASGLNAAGVPVIAASQSGFVRCQFTDEKGETVFEDLPFDRYEVLVGDPFMEGTVTSEQTPDYTYPYAITPKTNSITVDCTKELSFCQVSGNVPGLNGGEIILRSAENNRRKIYFVRNDTLDADGAFLFPYVPPGDYELLIRPSLGTSHLEPVSLTKGMKNKDIGRIDFSLCRISGVITAEEKNASIAGITVTIVSGRGKGELTTETDRKGGFAFEGIEPGSYHVRVKPDTEAFKPISQQISLITGFSMEPLRLSLKRASSGAAH